MGEAFRATFVSAAHVPGSLDGQEDRQIEPHAMWTWFADNHWKHWHGVLVKWRPFESSQALISCKSMRSFRAVDGAHRKHCIHRNAWYSGAGDGDGQQKLTAAAGPWDLYEDRHSLPDGIIHPYNTDSRVLQFPNGDLGWFPLMFGHPKRNTFGEVVFVLPSKMARVAIIMGLDGEGKLGVSQILEESKETEELDSSWEGTLWKHHCSPLEKIRAEPQGLFVGIEMTLTPGLMLTRRKATWRGFKGGIKDEVAQEYTLAHLPYGFTCCAPKKATIGEEHAFLVHWIVNEDEVRIMMWKYGENGLLQFLKTGHFKRSIKFVV